MIPNNNLTSLLIPSQLPEHIRDDPSYANFVTFIQAYYEWMEQDGNVTDLSKNLLDYNNIDSSIDGFLNYFYNDFLTYFPSEIMADKVEVVKLAKELYRSKGTPASYQLLFRILYDMDVDFFYTKDAVLKASDGKWYVSKSLKLATDLNYVDSITYVGNIITVNTVTSNDIAINDSITLSGTTATSNAPNGTWTVLNIIDDTTFTFSATNIPTGTIVSTNASVYLSSGYANKNFLKTNNLRIFGETTKTIATIENSVVSGKRIELFISNIERLFESGEYVRVVNSENQDVLFNGYPLRAKILGQVSQININPTNRGLLYQPLDPVIVYGGLNTIDGVGATAEVKETTAGSIQRIKVEYGSYGYTKFVNAGLPGSANTRLSITNAPGAQAHVTVNDSISNPNKVDVSFIPIDYIGLKKLITLNATNYNFSNIATSNITTSLANAFTFTGFSTYPISSVLVDNGGGGVTQIPVVTADSLYYTENLASLASLKNLGILAPIQIIDAGIGYVANDKIIFTGGTGYSAYANVTSVNASGSIVSTSFVHDANNKIVTLGGMGYTVGTPIASPNVANTIILNTLHNADYRLGTGLPTLSVISANVAAANAVLVIPGILGDGALFTPQVDRVGSITTINIKDYGEDYVSAPSVSIKVQDIIVKGLTLDNLPHSGDTVYQGVLNSGYVALVDSVTLLIPNSIATASVYRLRVYNYNAKPSFTTPLNVVGKTLSMSMTNEYNSVAPIDSRRDVNGVLTYGDGTAKATAKFLNGLTIGEGEYLNSTGHPSSFDVIQSTEYNNYTYKITLEKEIDKYRKTLLDLVHPTGMKVIGRYALKSEAHAELKVSDNLNTANTLLHYTGSSASNIAMSVPINTNLVPYSYNFRTPEWYYGYSTISPATTATTTIIDPLYGNEAFKISDDSSTLESYFQTGSIISPSISNKYTFSIYVKKGTSSTVASLVYFSGNSIKASYFEYNFDTDVMLGVGADGGGIIPFDFYRQKLNNGWIRLSFASVDSNNGLNGVLTYRLYPSTRAGVAPIGYTYFYGPQMELGDLSDYARTISVPTSSPGARSNNIVQVNGLGSANLNNFITPNSVITVTTTQGNGIYSEILSANTSANTITLKDNVWLTFANVAYVTANASSNVIHISSLTGQYDIINNGTYSNTAYPLMDIVRTGDNVIVANNMYRTVSGVDYLNNIIYVSTNLTHNVNSSMSVNRTLTANSAFVKFLTPTS